MPQSFQQFRGGDWLFSCLWGMGHIVVVVAIRVGFLLIAITVGVLRSLGEGGHVSAELAEDTQGTTAYQPWGSSVLD